MNRWTFNDIPDLTGKTVVVTGGNSGLGFESVKAFSRNNATVILASKSIKRGVLAMEKIALKFPYVNIRVMEVDLGDIKSINKFVTQFRDEYEKLDLLLNNAGIMWCPYTRTVDGFEAQMGINHLGHFALTGLLFDSLKKVRGSRIVNISSLGHYSAKWDINNLFLNKENYNPQVAYYNSKLANLLFTYEFQRRLESCGLNILSVAAHPGGSATNLGRHVEKSIWFKLLKPVLLLMTQSAAMGSLPGLRAATDFDVKSGDYYGPGGFNEIRGFPVIVNSSRDSFNPNYAEELWKKSEELTGVKFDFSLP